MAEITSRLDSTTILSQILPSNIPRDFSAGHILGILIANLTSASAQIINDEIHRGLNLELMSESEAINFLAKLHVFPRMDNPAIISMMIPCDISFSDNINTSNPKKNIIWSPHINQPSTLVDKVRVYDNDFTVGGLAKDFFIGAIIEKKMIVDADGKEVVDPAWEFSVYFDGRPNVNTETVDEEPWLDATVITQQNYMNYFGQTDPVVVFDDVIYNSKKCIYICYNPFNNLIMTDSAPIIQIIDEATEKLCVGVLRHGVLTINKDVDLPPTASLYTFPDLGTTGVVITTKKYIPGSDRQELISTLRLTSTLGFDTNHTLEQILLSLPSVSYAKVIVRPAQSLQNLPAQSVVMVESLEYDTVADTMMNARQLGLQYGQSLFGNPYTIKINNSNYTSSFNVLINTLQQRPLFGNLRIGKKISVQLDSLKVKNAFSRAALYVEQNYGNYSDSVGDALFLEFLLNEFGDKIIKYVSGTYYLGDTLAEKYSEQKMNAGTDNVIPIPEGIKFMIMANNINYSEEEPQ